MNFAISENEKRAVILSVEKNKLNSIIIENDNGKLKVVSS